MYRVVPYSSAYWMFCAVMAGLVGEIGMAIVVPGIRSLVTSAAGKKHSSPGVTDAEIAILSTAKPLSSPSEAGP